MKRSLYIVVLIMLTFFVISFLTNVNVMALLATRGLGVPVIVCERTNPAFSSNVGIVLRLLRKWTYPWASLVTVQAEASAEPFKRMVPGIRRLAVIPNPLPPELFDTRLAACVPDARGRCRLMAMGRLVPAKQFGALIQAFSTLAARHANWDLSIWGDGPLRGALIQQIEANGAEIVGPDDPQQWLADADRLRLLLREVFAAAGGNHDDWDEYDRVMAEQRRAVVMVEPSRVYTNG